MDRIRKKNPEVLVCTPGRLIDIIESYNLDLSQVEYFILDEGDRMLDMGFQQDIEYISKCIHNQDVRSMIFSATIPDFIQGIVKKTLKKPVMIDLVGDSENQLPEELETKAIIASDFGSKVAVIKQFVDANPDKKIMIFVETKVECAQFERLAGMNFLTLHGDMSQ